MLIILDRDGVINEYDGNYICSADEWHPIPGSVEAVARLCNAGHRIAIATNQSGIARGLVSRPEFEAVEAEIERQLAIRGVSLDLTIACPFHPDFTEGYGPELDRWRKPGPAMIEHGAELMGLDLAKSWLVGDKAADIEAANRAGLKGAILVLTGYGAEEREKALAFARPGFEVAVVRDLREARDLLEGAF